MTQRIKTFLIYLFITIVVLLVATVTVLLVFHDIRTPFKKLFKHEEPSVTSVEEITEKVEREHEAELSKEEEEAAKPPLEECIVEMVHGKIKGQKKEVKYSTDNETYYAFQGIRYAEAPVKEFRFKEPRPLENWDDVRDATKEGSVCPQKKFPGLHETEVIGSEDCLFLNVYTPQKPEEDNTSLKPVMIWIHGGGFQSGSGSSDYYGPDFIVKNNVLLVTFNYRLGALGFLNLRVEGAPGNAGLKDMVAVLKWVQENISKFGGDPKNVTLFGEDAGAAAIQVFMVLPQIRQSGLFHKVIIQSGSIMNPWAYDDEPEKEALDLVDQLNIKSQGYTEILESLYKTEPKDIVLAQDKIVTIDSIEKLELFAFVPSLEDPIQKDVNTKPGLLTVSPYMAFSSGHVPEIPTIIGFNNAEANIVFLYYPELITPKVLETLNNLPDSFLPRIISSIDSALFKNLTLNTIKKFYFNNERISWKHLPQFMDAISDITVAVGSGASMELLQQSHFPLYIYEFTTEGRLNYFGIKAKQLFSVIANKHKKHNHGMDKNNNGSDISPSDPTAVGNTDNNYNNNENNDVQITGASHMDELGYLFLVNKFDEKVPVDSTEYKVRERMCKMWTNFAKTSNPNADNEITDLEWPKSTSKKPAYLKIGNEFEVLEGNVESRRYNFWKTIFTAAFQENPGVIYDYLNKNKKDVIGK